jgi:hypothetical protein
LINLNFLSRIDTIKILFVVLALIVLIINTIINYYVFPVTEGWWETIGWLHNNGKNIYLDYDVKIQPLYILLISNLLLITDSFINLRHFFSFIHIISLYFSFLWIKKFVKPEYALSGIAISTFLLISNNTYLPKDYHTIVSLEVSISLFLLFCFGQKFSTTLSILMGLVVGLIFFTKQNIGIFYGGIILLYYITWNTYNNSIQNTVKNIISSLIGFSIIFFIIYSYFELDWLSTIIGNDSKGSPLQVLFRFLLDSNIRNIILVSLAICIFSFVIKNNKLIPEKFRTILFDSAIAFICLSSLFINSLFMAIVIAWPIVRSNRLEIDKKSFNFNSVCIAMLSLAYCNTLTAGFNYVGLEALITLFVAEYLGIIKVYLRRFVFIIPIILISSVSINKIVFNNPYDWWGLKTEKIYSGNFKKVNGGYLDGIYIDEFTSKFFNQLDLLKLSLNSNLDNNVLAVSSIPIVYLYLNIQPKIPPIVWFDMASTNTTRKFMNEISNSRPKYIIQLDIPQFVFDGHFKLMKRDPTLYEIDKWIIENYMQGNYNISYSLANINSLNSFKSINDSKKIESGCFDYKYFNAPVGIFDNDLNCKKFTIKNEYALSKFIEENPGKYTTDYYILNIYKIIN